MLFVPLNHCLKPIYCILTIGNPGSSFPSHVCSLGKESHLPKKSFFLQQKRQNITPEQSVCWGALARGRHLKLLSLPKCSKLRHLISCVDAITTMQLCKIEAAYKASTLFTKGLPESLCFAQSTSLLANVKSRGAGKVPSEKLPTKPPQF